MLVIFIWEIGDRRLKHVANIFRLQHRCNDLNQSVKDGNVTFKNVGINDWITLNWHHMEGCHFKPGRQQITMILKNLRINDTGELKKLNEKPLVFKALVLSSTLKLSCGSLSMGISCVFVYGSVNSLYRNSLTIQCLDVNRQDWI